MHDANGDALKVGDLVRIPGTITSLSNGEEFCNVTVETRHGRRPDGKKEMISAINTGVLLKEFVVDDGSDALNALFDHGVTLSGDAQPLMSVPPAAELLAYIHSMLSPIAKWTPTSIDDRLVRLIEALQKSEDLLKFIDEIVLTLAGGGSLPFASIPFPEAELRRAAAMAGVDWGQLVMVLLPLLTELLRKAIEYFARQPAGPSGPAQPAGDYSPRTKPRCK